MIGELFMSIIDRWQSNPFLLTMEKWEVLLRALVDSLYSQNNVYRHGSSKDPVITPDIVYTWLINVW